MHCPQCGLEQVLGETRFCRACGFELEDVKQLVSEKRGEKYRARRRRTAFSQGLGLMLLSLIFVIVMSLIQNWVPIPEIVLKTVAGALVLAGIIRMFYPYVIDRADGGVAKGSESALADAGAETTKLSLPPSQISPIEWPAGGADMNEPLPVGSVTERTTRNLENEGVLPKQH